MPIDLNSEFSALFKVVFDGHGAHAADAKSSSRCTNFSVVNQKLLWMRSDMIATLFDFIFGLLHQYWLPVITFVGGLLLSSAIHIRREDDRLSRLSRGIKIPASWKTDSIDVTLDGKPLSKEEMSLSALIVRGETGHGSGVCVSSSGLVLTNAHVVGDSQVVEVEDEGNSYLGVVVKTDTERDAAVILVGSKNLPVAAVASESVSVGDDLFVAGTPVHLENRGMLTKGVVSKIGPFKGTDFIHMDAAIDRGNSGGPVFNEHGELVGISVAGQLSSDGKIGHIGLAIPLAEFLECLKIRDGVVPPDPV